MDEYTFCEIVRGYSRLHIRRLTYRGRRPHLKPNTKTLCGITAVRDVALGISGFYLDRSTCSDCVQAYRKAMEGTEND